MAQDGDIRPEVVVMEAVVAVGLTFTQIAADLRKLPDVVEVSHPIRMERVGELVPGVSYTVGSGSGFEIDWYAYAEFADDRALTFSQVVRWHGGTWTVEAEVLCHDRDGGRELIEFPEVTAVSLVDLVAGLRNQADALAGSTGRALDLFFGSRS